jgi:large subunit ribosomal protein L2
MGIKAYKPTTPGRRGASILKREGLAKEGPQRSLSFILKRKGGRNNLGRVTVKGRGGGAKRKYRIVDFKRDKMGIPAKVLSIEYDPNRTANIALLLYADGERRYILCPEGLKVGESVVCGEGVEIKVGNALPLRSIPLGTPIHNIELRKGRGGQLVRSAGAAAQILAKEGDFAHIRLPSGEVRLVHLDCMATVGQVGNIDWENVDLGKAGRRRWMGRRPRTRGVAMNPVDHPLGGGEGRSKGGRHPCSRTGVLAKGYKTRRCKRTDRFILRRRK